MFPQYLGPGNTVPARAGSADRINSTRTIPASDCVRITLEHFGFSIAQFAVESVIVVPLQSGFKEENLSLLSATDKLFLCILVMLCVFPDFGSRGQSLQVGEVEITAQVENWNWGIGRYHPKHNCKTIMKKLLAKCSSQPCGVGHLAPHNRRSEKCRLTIGTSSMIFVAELQQNTTHQTDLNTYRTHRWLSMCISTALHSPWFACCCSASLLGRSVLKSQPPKLTNNASARGL